MINLSSLNTGRARVELSNEDLRRKAPSIFALEPWQGDATRAGMSEKYRFIPTVDVVNALRDANFYPVQAAQSRSRIPGKQEFTRHMLRFRLRGQDSPSTIGERILEMVLTNSHDGTACYNLMLGIFELVCGNGLVVCSSLLESIRARHTGSQSLPQQVINGSLALFDKAPGVINRVAEFQRIELSPEEQEGYAVAALPLLDSSLDITPEAILQPRRREDRGTGSQMYFRPAPTLWKTFNVVQENMLKGGARGLSTTGRRIHTRAIQAVDRDVKLNKALWTLTEKMAELKGATI